MLTARVDSIFSNIADDAPEGGAGAYRNGELVMTKKYECATV